MRLRISERLFLPVDWMTLATVIYGSRGSGKTSLAAVFAEEVSKAGQRFCAIDLKGDLYGLKSTADGKGDGIPVVIFGGEHQDVPLEDGAGAFVGETVAGLGQSCVLDLEHFSKGKQVRFLAAFFEALYDRNRDPLLLILDEAQRYAPQGRMIDPDTAKCLGAVEDIVKLGRKHGVGPVLLTQRGSGLNKEVSELCDMLVAFRTPGPLDQDRVKDWLDANTTKVQRDEVMGQLSGLPTGTAVFASGHPDLKIFGVYPVRRRETFDSSATPKVGQRRKEPKRLAKPDLDELKSKMSAAIERQKADDPKALRGRIAELEREVKAKVAPATTIVKAPKVERVEVPVLSGADRKLLVGSERWATRWATTAEEIAAAAKKWTEKLAAIDARIAAVTGKPAPRFLPAPRAVGAGQPKPGRGAMHPAAPKTNGAVELGKGERATMIAIAQHPNGVTREQLTVLTGYKRSTRDAYLQRLKAAGFTDGDPIVGTDSGIAWLGPDYDPLPTGDALRAHWLGKLPEGERKILEILCSIYPASSERDAISEKTGYARSSRDAYLQRLGARKLVANQGRGAVVASSELFS